MQQYYLGIDVGTTSAKAVAFSTNGEVMLSFSCPYKMYHPQPNWSEQDPEEISTAVIACFNKIVHSFTNQAPVFVSFSSAMHGIMAIGNDSKPITNCIIWADNRASEIAVRLKNSNEGKFFYETTGVPIHSMSPLCKLLWLKENEPEIFNRAYKFISIKEYIYHKFFGEYIVDTSIASATGLLNLRSLEWDKNILDFLGITSASLSTVVSTKHKKIFNKELSEDNKALLIPTGVTFIIGGSDGTLANLGAGASNMHSMVVSIGTSGAARVLVNTVETDSKMQTFCYHLKDGYYVIGGPSNNGAIVLEWLKNTLLETTESFPDLFSRAEKINAGSDDLLLIPYILGERAPIWNSNARGVFFGLNINHTKSHLIRACMEGIIYGMYSIIKILLEKRVITEIYATGGFAQSSLWLQMLADVCNIKVLVSGSVEGSALGAVMLGVEALDKTSIPQQEILASYEPNLFTHEIYLKGFEKFARIYELLKNEFNEEEIPYNAAGEFTSTPLNHLITTL